MQITIDNDGNFLFDGEICTDDRIDDIRDFVNNANEAFVLIKSFCSGVDPEDMTDNITSFYNKFYDLLEKSGHYNDGTANCIDNPEAIALVDPGLGSNVHYWYDSQGNQHPS